MTKKIVIIGAGFGGLAAAKSLGNKKGIEVYLIDRRNHHLFQPLLYQVALAGLSPAEIAMPIRQILAAFDNVHVILGRVERVDLTNRLVELEGREFAYDELIIATGASHSYFGKDQWEEFAPGLKTLEQATEIRRRILLSYEQAELAADDREAQRRFLTFVVVGGGPTGVELAGAIAEISRKTLVTDFDRIDPSHSRVILIEGGERILPAFSAKLSQKAQMDLEYMGVTVWTNSLVTDISDKGVKIGEDFIAAHTVIWAAGVKPASLLMQLPFPKDPVGRVKVNKDLSVPGHAHVFVIGDSAHCQGTDGRPLPGLAPVASQQGRFVGQLIWRELKGFTRKDFKYADKGMMATIGRKKAVAEVGDWQFTGMLAWLAWLFVHIYYLIGFKNKLFVLLNWTWQYFTFKRSARLILSKDWREII